MTRFPREKTSRISFVTPDEELEGRPLPQSMSQAIAETCRGFDQIVEVHLVHSLDKEDDRERKWALAVVLSKANDDLETAIFKAILASVRGGPEIRMVPMEASDPRLPGLRDMDCML